MKQNKLFLGKKYSENALKMTKLYLGDSAKEPLNSYQRAGLNEY